MIRDCMDSIAGCIGKFSALTIRSVQCLKSKGDVAVRSIKSALITMWDTVVSSSLEISSSEKNKPNQRRNRKICRVTCSGLCLMLIAIFIYLLVMPLHQRPTTNDQRPTGESNSTRREMDRQAFAESIQHYPAKGSHSKGVIVDEVHKLAYCYITKNACTKFKLLFHTLATNGTRFDVALSDQALRLGSSSIHETMLSFTGEKGFLADTLIKNASSDWSTFLVVRDPAERLLSGFKNKCLGPKWCEGSALNKTAFAVFAERVIDKVQNGRVINDHFLPQHQQCGLDVLYPKYVDDVVVYNKETVAADTIRFLEKHHLEAFNEGYGEFGNETLFETQTGHTTRGKGDDCSFYQQYYDKELYQKVRGAFSRDYDLFGLDEPEWTKCLQ